MTLRLASEERAGLGEMRITVYISDNTVKAQSDQGLSCLLINKTSERQLAKN